MLDRLNRDPITAPVLDEMSAQIRVATKEAQAAATPEEQAQFTRVKGFGKLLSRLARLPDVYRVADLAALKSTAVDLAGDELVKNTPRLSEYIAHTVVEATALEQTQSRFAEAVAKGEFSSARGLIRDLKPSSLLAAETILRMAATLDDAEKAASEKSSMGQAALDGLRGGPSILKAVIRVSVAIALLLVFVILARFAGRGLAALSRDSEFRIVDEVARTPDEEATRKLQTRLRAELRDRILRRQSLVHFAVTSRRADPFPWEVSGFRGDLDSLVAQIELGDAVTVGPFRLPLKPILSFLYRLLVPCRYVWVGRLGRANGGYRLSLACTDAFRGKTLGSWSAEVQSTDESEGIRLLIECVCGQVVPESASFSDAMKYVGEINAPGKQLEMLEKARLSLLTAAEELPDSWDVRFALAVMERRLGHQAKAGLRLDGLRPFARSRDQKLHVEFQCALLVAQSPGPRSLRDGIDRMDPLLRQLKRDDALFWFATAARAAMLSDLLTSETEGKLLSELERKAFECELRDVRKCFLAGISPHLSSSFLSSRASVSTSEAWWHLESGRVEEGIHLYEAALLDQPASVEAQLGLADALLRGWRPDGASVARATKVLLDAERLHPGLSELKHLNGKVALAQGRVAEGLALLRLAASEDPSLRDELARAILEFVSSSVSAAEELTELIGNIFEDDLVPAALEGLASLDVRSSDDTVANLARVRMEYLDVRFLRSVHAYFESSSLDALIDVMRILDVKANVERIRESGTAPRKVTRRPDDAKAVPRRHDSLANAIRDCMKSPAIAAKRLSEQIGNGLEDDLFPDALVGLASLDAMSSDETVRDVARARLAELDERYFRALRTFLTDGSAKALSDVAGILDVRARIDQVLHHSRQETAAETPVEASEQDGAAPSEPLFATKTV